MRITPLLGVGIMSPDFWELTSQTSPTEIYIYIYIYTYVSGWVLLLLPILAAKFCFLKPEMRAIQTAS